MKVVVPIGLSSLDALCPREFYSQPFSSMCLQTIYKVSALNGLLIINAIQLNHHVEKAVEHVISGHQSQ